MSTFIPSFLGGEGRGRVLSGHRTSLKTRLVGLFIKALPALAVISLCFAGALAFSLALGERALFYTREGGMIENLTVVFYGAVLLAGLFLVSRGHKAAGLVALLSLLMGLRELDAHKAFTTYGVFKTRLYVSPDVPLAEKLVAALVVVGLLVLVVLAIRASWRTLGDPRSAAGITLLGLGGFGLFLKGIDGLPRELADIGLALDPGVLAVSKAVEETGELGLPVLLALALIQLFYSRAGGLVKNYTRF